MIKRIRTSFYQNLIEPLVASKNPPSFDARGVSFGLIVGFLAPIGTHVISLCLIRFAFRFHFGIAFAFTFVSNPLNVVPLYYGYYYMGSWLLGKPVTLELEGFEKLLSPVLSTTYFWEAVSAFAALGYEILLRWFVSAVVLSVVFGALGYVVTYKIQVRRCKRAALRMGMNYEHYLEQLEKDTETRSTE
ncbi:MAG: DUF2062 domain-containing protein [Desulfomonile tiedjei]|uniref:DUF2062 domain-containing protein n=1 Tax=Desulfomonile tiedjei TaxID=2358 RepID=A0A9D6V345_9BACT|nr:DUF2062 domain-containing protein [Desulfomonile tiedjei]